MMKKIVEHISLKENIVNTYLMKNEGFTQVEQEQASYQGT